MLFLIWNDQSISTLSVLSDGIDKQCLLLTRFEGDSWGNRQDARMPVGGAGKHIFTL